MGLRGRMERQQRIIGCHDATSSHVGPFGERLPVLLREIVTVPSAVEIQENWLRIVCGIRLEDLHAVHAIFPHRPGELDSCRNQNGPFVRQIRLVSFVLLQVQCPEADDLVHEEGLRGPAVEQFDSDTGKQERRSNACQRPKEFLGTLHRSMDQPGFDVRDHVLTILRSLDVGGLDRDVTGRSAIGDR